MRRFGMMALAAALSVTAAAQQGNDGAAQAEPVVRMAAAGRHADVAEKINALRFDEARALIESKQRAAKKLRKEADRKAATAGLDELSSRCTEGMNALSGTDRVLIVDSVVVDKARFLDAYGITPDMGRLAMSADGATVGYRAELNGMELVPRSIDDGEGGTRLAIVRRFADDDGERPQPVEGLGVDGDQNYPFLLSDGQRFYFAARSDDGHGNYDIYATRYDNDSKRFYRAENMGFPYNSYANDYMLVIDEADGIGWFASDRYQPADRVCVYTFIPHESRRTYADGELTDRQRQCAASLRSIRELQALYTDDERADIERARAAVAALYATSKQTRRGDFEFVVNNSLTYRSINDFRSPKARQLCKQWQQFVKNRDTLSGQLAAMRDNAPANAPRIRSTEQRLLELGEDINSLAKKIRAEELGQ